MCASLKKTTLHWAARDSGSSQKLPPTKPRLRRRGSGPSVSLMLIMSSQPPSPNMSNSVSNLIKVWVFLPKHRPVGLVLFPSTTRHDRAVAEAHGPVVKTGTKWTESLLQVHLLPLLQAQLRNTFQRAISPVSFTVCLFKPLLTDGPWGK